MCITLEILNCTFYLFVIDAKYNMACCIGNNGFPFILIGKYGMVQLFLNP